MKCYPLDDVTSILQRYENLFGMPLNKIIVDDCFLIYCVKKENFFFISITGKWAYNDR